MNAETRIERVTIYSDRARIERVARLHIPPGRHVIAIPDLPVLADENSVRASVRGAKLLSLDVKRSRYLEPPSANAHELEKKIEDLTDQISLIDRSIAVEQERSAHFEKLGGETLAIARGIASGRMEISKHTELESSIAEEKKASTNRIIQLSKQKRQTVRELAKADLEYKNAGNAVSRERIECSLEVESEGKEVEMQISYIVGSASWLPRYDFRLGSKLLMQYLGAIRQKTGEAWQNVELSLSTAPASDQIAPVEFSTWFLHEYVPPPPRPAAAPGMIGAPPMQASARAADAPFEQEEVDALLYAGMEDSTSVSSGASITYTLTSRFDIPGNGEEKKVPVTVQEFARELEYVTAPANGEQAFRRVRFTNDSAYLLLGGPGFVYYDQDFVGNTSIEETPPGQKRELYLGIESRIRVKRELKLRETDKKLLGDTKRTRFRYQIDLENHLPEEAVIILREQIPASTHASIKVKLETQESKPELPLPGILEWKFTLPAGAKREVSYDYVVEHPQNMTILGLH